MRPRVIDLLVCISSAFVHPKSLKELPCDTNSYNDFDTKGIPELFFNQMKDVCTLPATLGYHPYATEIPQSATSMRLGKH
jgi:hypothetical protein